MKNYLFAVFVVILSFSSCTTVKKVYLPFYSKEITYLDNSLEFYADKNIKKCKLSDTTILNDFKCVSWIWFFENGQIKQFETAKEIQLKNFVIPANSRIFFNEQKRDKIKYIWFSKNVFIGEIECKGEGKISTEFYDNGNLMACFLGKNQNIQGFPCQASVFEPVYFYPDGKIKILTLSKDSSYNNVSYKKGESIIVAENGTVNKFKR